MNIEISTVEEALAQHGHALKDSPTLPMMRLNQTGFATFSTDRGYATVKCGDIGEVVELNLYELMA